MVVLSLLLLLFLHLSGNKMLSTKGEQRTFSNGRLRDQWEKRAQSIADDNKKEEQWKQKSSTNL